MPNHAYAAPCRRIVRFLLLSSLALFAACAQAGTVWMDNGDRITGNILSLDNGILLVNTPYGGDVRLQFKHVKTLQSDKALVIRDKSVEHDYYAKLVSADQGKVQVEGVQRSPDGDNEVKTDVALSSLQSMTAPKPLLGETAVKGKLDLSLAQKTASVNSQNYAAAFSLDARRGLWRNVLSAAYNRSKDGDDVGTDNYGGDYALDRFLTEKAFWQGRIRYKRDFVEEVSRQTAYGTGPGYQFWDDELGAFSLSALVGRVEYGYSDGGNEGFFAGGLRWNYTRYLSGKQFQVYTNGEFYRALGDAGFGLNGEVGLRYNINSTLSLYVKYARDLVTGTRESMNESIYGTGVGWSF
ncbi:hypothetical protein CAL12_05985 [Bordetella genomosp. 8]|uniref:Peptide chain release factor RF-3 n=1 Tax=Bordetella genomosp. 8 TaxID=1416806 RepID=A0A1W6YH49_9BORD|nr:DUF481 domain-containing protein [Bordetella genomosp. 8]ARP80426.1 hypothetical protein CAL12_05985 [Bordetella genomosp. 8]